MWKPIILDVECIVCNKSLQKINHDPHDVTRKMGKIANRRSRTPNWSAEEKQYLLELIRERRVVITRTNNGPNHYEEKDIAWNEILRELANKFGNKFTGSSIKKVKTQWQNMKRIAREEISLNGPEVQKYTRQSFEVCNILELVKDGVLKNNEQGASLTLNETATSNVPNIEIKTERIDEDIINQPSCSTNNYMETETESHPDQAQNNSTQASNSNQYESSSSVSDQNSEAAEFETQETQEEETRVVKDVSANTETSFLDDISTLNPFHRSFQEFMSFSTTERQQKMETWKEERQIMRAMRDTAELNKIIAEQRLKHILWMKKQEMGMYAGEPGSGAGKGGGGGGAIREAGGSFGKMEAAREDEYFYKKQKEQIANLRTHLDKEISFHQEQIKRHEDAIRRHKQTMNNMDSKN